MKRALLDVNVLLALLDGSHVHHRLARAWWRAEHQAGWASCAVTENGFVRIISQPRYPQPVSPVVGADLLSRARASGRHTFWACDISVVDGAVDLTRVLSSRQLTDAYLLALAVRHGGRLVTFDRGVGPAMVKGAGPDHVTCL